ncbi:hypothetical protein [Homoserinimonas sp. OAct 916]|uniref:hypothetical protein n=1 Tax=Homoserinimonas sp. OAct 916 TaxID=2211450 RepID=UPI000DBE2C09|nr:hypothetical protein [Homoserinimonas sp. OAct 916]
MSDDLILSGAGSTTVASSELVECAARAALLSSRLAGCADEIVWAYRYEGAPAPSWGRESPELHLLDAENWLRRASTLAKDLASGLDRAAEGYGAAERAATSIARFTAAQSAYLLGLLLPHLIAALLPVFGGAAVGARLALTHRRGRRRSVRGGATGEPGTGTGTATATGAGPESGPGFGPIDAETARRMLRDPRVIAMLGVLISSVDDTAAGMGKLPHAVQAALGGEGLGYIGVGASAALLTILAGDRLRESAIAVHRTGLLTAVVPTSIAELAARIPPAQPGKPQVSIERYLDDFGTASWLVYVGGTIDAGSQSGAEPWDMTSNVRAIARAQAGSVTATMRAMDAAGIAPTDPLILVGHSQGGLVAAAVAASDRFGRGEHIGLLTFGSPTGQLPLPETVRSIGIEHFDDPIPALGGVGLADNPRLLVRRQVFTDSVPPAGDWLPAHSMDHYRDTAALLDEVSDARLDHFASLLSRLSASSDGTRSLWRAKRMGGP